MEVEAGEVRGEKRDRGGRRQTYREALDTLGARLKLAWKLWAWRVSGQREAPCAPMESSRIRGERGRAMIFAALARSAVG
jgi:hypothetical protein